MTEDAEISEDPREAIARLETRIEQFADDLERCRKIAVLANVMIAGGVLWLIAALIGMASPRPAMLGSIAAVLGGLVLSGSNRSSTRQAQAALDATEASRARLIESIELRTIEGRIEPDPQRLH